MGVLDSITLEQKMKAFEKAKAEADIPEGKLIVVTEDYHDAALKFVKECFVKDEPVTRAVGLQWRQEMTDMWVGTFKDHMTLAVWEETSGRVIAIRGTCVLNKDFAFDASNYDDPAMKIMCDIYEKGCQGSNFFEKFGVDQTFHFFGFGVDKDFRSRGLGGRLFKAQMVMLKHLGLDSFCIRGEASSKFSARVYEKNGFQMLYELPYDEYIVDGKQVVCNTGEHKAYKIYGIKVVQE